MLSLAVDRSRKILHVRIAGVLTEQGIAEIDRTVRAFLRAEGPHRRIMDLSEVESVDIPHELLLSRATNVPVSAVMTPSRIYVAPTDYLYGMARMFTSYQAARGAPPTRMVRSLAEAHELFALDAPAFQPVLGEAA